MLISLVGGFWLATWRSSRQVLRPDFPEVEVPDAVDPRVGAPVVYFEYSRKMVDLGANWPHIRLMKIDDAAARLEALGNPTRLKIYRTLVRAGRAGLPVGRLQDRLKVPASTLSHHVKSLIAVGLISQVREGTTLVCHAEYDTMQGLVDFLVAECCADEIACKETKSAA
jgi:DNA-binding transcriptional ArsR family regulator